MDSVYTSLVDFIEDAEGFNLDSLRFFLRRRFPNQYINLKEIKGRLAIMLGYYELHEQYEKCRLVHSLIKEIDEIKIA